MKASQILVFMVTAAAAIALLTLARAGFKDQADAAFWNSLSGAGKEVAELRAENAESLAGSPLPIDEAMVKYAQQGRKASPLLEPAPAEPTPPLNGWLKHPDYEKRVAAAKQFTEERAAAESEAEDAENDEAAAEGGAGDAPAAEAAE